MSIQLIGGALICIVGLAVIGYAVMQRMRNSRTKRTRALTETAANVQRCWQIIERVPVAYLPASLKRLVARIVQGTSSRALKLAPTNAFLLEQDAKSRMLLASAAREQPPAHRPMLTPKDRKAVTESLRDLKRLANHAKQNGIIPAPECNRELLVIDAVLLRIMVDHLKQNAFNCEAIGHPEDAVGYIVRAVQALSSANEGGRFKDEIGNLNREIERLRDVVKLETERRRGKDTNMLAQGLQAQASRDGGGVKRAQYDAR